MKTSILLIFIEFVAVTQQQNYQCHKFVRDEHYRNGEEIPSAHEHKQAKDSVPDDRLCGIQLIVLISCEDPQWMILREIAEAYTDCTKTEFQQNCQPYNRPLHVGAEKFVKRIFGDEQQLDITNHSLFYEHEKRLCCCIGSECNWWLPAVENYKNAMKRQKIAIPQDKCVQPTTTTTTSTTTTTPSIITAATSSVQPTANTHSTSEPASVAAKPIAIGSPYIYLLLVFVILFSLLCLAACCAMLYVECMERRQKRQQGYSEVPTRSKDEQQQSSPNCKQYLVSTEQINLTDLPTVGPPSKVRKTESESLPSSKASAVDIPEQVWSETSQTNETNSPTELEAAIQPQTDSQERLHEAVLVTRGEPEARELTSETQRNAERALDTSAHEEFVTAKE